MIYLYILLFIIGVIIIASIIRKLSKLTQTIKNILQAQKLQEETEWEYIEATLDVWSENGPSYWIWDDKAFRRQSVYASYDSPTKVHYFNRLGYEIVTRWDEKTLLIRHRVKKTK